MEIPCEEALAKASEPRTEKPRLSSITLTADDNTPIELEFDPEEVFYLVDLNGVSYGTLEITATPENEDDTVTYINPEGGILESPQTGNFFAVQVSNEQQSTTYIVAITGSDAGSGGGTQPAPTLTTFTVGTVSVPTPPLVIDVTLSAGSENVPVQFEWTVSTDTNEVHYSTDNGGSWSITASTGGTYSESFTVAELETKIVLIRLTSAGGAQSIYYIIVKRDGSADNLLLSLTVGGSSVAIAYTMYPTYAEIGYPAGTFDIVASPSPYNAEVTYSGDVSISGSTLSGLTLTAGDRKTILITVTAQNGLSKTHALTLYKPDAYYVSNGGDNNNSGETAAAPFNQLKTALDAAKASNGTVPKVVVMGELTVANATGLDSGSFSTFKLDNYGTPGGTITISGMNNAVLRAASPKRVLDIDAGNYLNFENITLTGGNISGSYGGGINIKNSHITLSNGTRITGNKANSGLGGGVCINAGTLIIAGADISNNMAKDGGGIALDGANVVTFTQGAISGNLSGNLVSRGSGGGVIVTNSVFTMDGGNIYGNSTTNNGGGVYIVSGTMTYNSGIIKTNVAGSGGTSIHSKGTLNGTIGETLLMTTISGGSYTDNDLLY
ncbi:hypothetical protein AGMMS50212_14830 [Spirochaetia bacterium]|nr:hypothetical protein AGMMS50212_14830 [Spirochaetia bacterium]